MSPETEALLAEVEKQLSLGHVQFCWGVHETGEEEWGPWSGVCRRLAAALRAAEERAERAEGILRGIGRPKGDSLGARVHDAANVLSQEVDRG